MTLRIAVFGANGQLGRALQRRAKTALAAFDRAEADITDAAAVRAAIRDARPEVVINAAAFTAVDRAETEQARAFAVNRDGAANVAAAAAAAGARTIHVSTDYVFDGRKHDPYTEEDPVNPIGVYAKSKAEGEAAVRKAAPDAVILRTAWVFGLDGANFVKTMLRLAQERDAIGVVADQKGCPTFADDLADAILAIAAKPGAGTFHLAGQGATTWHGFAHAVFDDIAKRGRRVPRLDAIATVDYPTPAKRPANSVLDCAKARRSFGVVLPPWQDGLRRMLAAHMGGA